jgi:hypothetical protein
MSNTTHTGNTETIELQPSLFVIVMAVCKLHVKHDDQAKHPRFNGEAAKAELSPYVRRLFAQPLKHSQESNLIAGLIDLQVEALVQAYKRENEPDMLRISQQLEALAAQDAMAMEVGGPR